MRAASGGRRVGIGAAAVLLLGAGAGCAQESDADLVTATPANFEASPGYVAGVVQAAESDTYRYSMSFSFAIGGQSFDADVASGAYDGERSQMETDLGAMVQAMGEGFGEDVPGSLADADLTMEQIVDRDTIYIRAPFFSNLSDLLPNGGLSSSAGGAMFDVYDQLGDGWGKVDVDALGDVLPDEAEAALAGGQNGSPQVYLDLLAQTDDVDDLGTDEIDGDEVHGLAAQVDFGDLLKAAGTDPDQLDGGAASDVIGNMASMTFPLEVWVDGDDHVRRIEFSFTPETFGEIAEDQGGDAGDITDAMGDFSMDMTMDFEDYGDDSISVEPPSDAVDVTDDFVAAYQDMFG
jgi:hypothetical protein